MPDNRRQHQRLELDHPASLVAGGRPAARCQVRNFSKGGLFLHIDAAILNQLKIDSRELKDNVLHAFVQLLDAKTGEPLAFEIPVRMAFSGQDGFGVAFMNPSQEVLDYFTKQHQKYSTQIRSPSPVHKPLSEEGRKLLEDIRQMLNNHISERMPHFLRVVSESLLEVSDHVSLQQQPNFTYASSKFSASETTLLNALTDRVAENWEQMLSPAPESLHARTDEAQQLELVDQDEFDEWAALMGIARRVEGRFSNTLHTLSQCLAYVVRFPISSDSSPLSPYSILWAFRKALVPLDLHIDAREIAYQVFGEQVLAPIQGLYHLIYERMEQDGVTADIAVRYISPEDEQKDTATSAADRRKPKKLVNKLGSYFNRGKREKAPVPASSTVSNAAVSNALDDMVQGDTRGLADRIEQSLGGHAGEGGKVSLPTESRQIIDATEQLIQAAQQDPRHNSTMRQLLRQIQLPMAKAALQDPDVLNDANGASRKLLDDIDQLALLTPDGVGSSLVQQTNAELKNILDALKAAGGKADLETVSGQISDLLTRRQNDFQENLKQVQAGCSEDMQAKERLLEVRAFLKEQLGEDISILVDRLLRLGWTGLLAETATRGDLMAKQLKAYKDALTLINKVFQVKRETAKLGQENLVNLKRILEMGFKSYPLYLREGKQLVEEIGQSIGGNQELFSSFNKERVTVDSAYLDQLLPGTVAEPDIEIDEKWKKAISKIQVGDWITEQLKQGQARLLNLAWVAPARQRFVFVDGTGAKALDCHQVELGTGIRMGTYSIIEDAGLPVVDRAVDRVLRKTFDRLREESDIDPVTGLPNRRAYERELLRLIQVATAEASMHILMCIDVDKFSLVNDLYGFEGGDRMLDRIGNICKSLMMKPGLMARTGDNEFSILVENCGIDEGFRIAESVRKAIESFRFDWGGKHISVTVSIGLTEITSEGGLADEITMAANSACDQAKKDGHNQCRRYQLEGEAFAQHKRLAESVPLIEKAIEEDNLDLYAQLIEPIFIGDGHSVHHEILLRHMDENGDAGSPFELIQAAEQYDRMRLVDRWVVQRFFRWISSAAESHDISKLGAFSINMSGQSATDEQFSKFLLRQIEESPISPEQLAFEITETSLVTQLDKARGMVEALKEKGCSFFLDDFGSGYASYSYLKELPVDMVKIDGIFIKDIHQDEASYAMVKSITDVAHHLGKLVVAEYVENQPILAALRRLEVDFAQGYEVGKPAPLDTLLQQHVF